MCSAGFPQAGTCILSAIWTCNDKATEKYLNSIVVYPEKFSYDPNPELTLADKAAILTEGKIIEINQNPASPNAIY